MKRDDDILWKGLLEEVFDDLLRFIFPGMEEVFDFKRGFEFLDKELAQMYPEPGKESATRFVDKLVKVFRKDGKEEWLLVHIEVQGPTSKRALFAERMFRYFYRIFDRYKKPVTGVAIFTGKDGKRMPDEFRYACLNTQLVYRYNTLSVLDFTDKELEESDNPFAVVMLVAKKALLKGKNLDGRLLKEKLMIVRLLRKKGFSDRKIHKIMVFLHNYVRFEKPEMNRKFEVEVDKITGKKNYMGIVEQLAEIRAAEALEKGREEASRLFVKNLLKDGNFTQVKIASLANVSLAFVRKVKKAVAVA